MIDDLITNNGCIVVEGIHDAKILVDLEIPRDRIVILGDHKYEVVVDFVCSRFDVVYLFTDFDLKGTIKAHKLVKMLTLANKRVVDFRKVFKGYLSRFGFKSIGKIEELKRFSQTISKPNEITLRALRKSILL